MKRTSWKFSANQRQGWPSLVLDWPEKHKLTSRRHWVLASWQDWSNSVLMGSRIYVSAILIQTERPSLFSDQPEKKTHSWKRMLSTCNRRWRPNRAKKIYVCLRSADLKLLVTNPFNKLKLFTFRPQIISYKQGKMYLDVEVSKTKTVFILTALYVLGLQSKSSWIQFLVSPLRYQRMVISCF